MKLTTKKKPNYYALIKCNTLLKMTLTFTIVMLCHSNVSAAISYNFSAFGTVGYAISDQPYQYIQYVDNEGTFAQDSLIAGQLDIQFTPKLTTTIQVKLAADKSQESGIDPELTWAFLSYRPNNEWVINLGMLPIPGYLNSVNRDVGVTYDYVRLPAEFDSKSPVNNILGVSISKIIPLPDSEFIIDAYAGRAKHKWRYYIGDDLDETYSTGATYNKVTLDLIGTSITYKTTENTYLAGIHMARIKNYGDSLWLKEIGYQAFSPDIGFYNNYASDGAVAVDSYDMFIANIGADIHLGNDFRLASELILRKNMDIDIGLNTLSGYVSLRKTMNKWTPYLLYSQIKTETDTLDTYQKINNNEIPNGVLSDAQTQQINTSQHVLADIHQGYDQFSIALGTSYRFNPLSVLKAEVMFVQVNDASNLFDISSDYQSSNYNATIFTVSYSFAF